jgi:hypothetical protein
MDAGNTKNAQELGTQNNAKSAKNREGCEDKLLVKQKSIACTTN